MKTYKSTNNTSNFSLHDSRLSKAYIKDNQDVICEFDKDGTYIFDSNKENPYNKTLQIKDVAISYKDVYCDS
nr:hypothetical protein [uncultured Aminipila sp.]